MSKEEVTQEPAIQAEETTTAPEAEAPTTTEEATPEGQAIGVEVPAGAVMPGVDMTQGRTEEPAETPEV